LEKALPSFPIAPHRKARPAPRDRLTTSRRRGWPSRHSAMGVAEYDPYGPVATPGRVARPPDVSFGYAHETSALESGASDMKQMADLVAAQMHALRGIVARADEAGSATSKALEAREAVETEWWDAREAASDSKLISYQKTDHYVKRAATRAAAQRKFVTNKNAGKSLMEACEDLRLASVVLKQTHDEETKNAEASAKRDAKLAEAVKKEHEALRLFRSETNAAVETVARSMAELKDNLDRAAVAAARQAKEVREAQEQRDAERAAAGKTRQDDADVPMVPRIEHVHASRPATRASLADSPETSETASPAFRVGDDDTERSPSFAESGELQTATPPKENLSVEARTMANDPDPALVEELRETKARAEAAETELLRVRRKLTEERESLTSELDALRARHARESAEVSGLAADAEKWRAMYDAVKRDARRRDSAVDELDALRDAARKADEKHAREIATLGAEHGAAQADARRALLAADRRVADLEPALEAAEARARALDEQVRSERERRRDVEEELARARGDLQRRGRDLSLAQDETAQELLSVSEQLERVKRRAADERESLERALETARAAANARVDEAAAGSNTSWRVASLENELRKASESASAEREETGRLRAELERLSEQLKVARETTAAAARSDLPGVVASLEAEVRRAAQKSAAEKKHAAELAAVETARVADLHRSELKHQKDLGAAEVKRFEALAKSARAETDGVRAELSRLEAETTRLARDLRKAESSLAEESMRTAAAAATAQAEVKAAAAAATMAAAKGDEKAEAARRAEVEKVRRDAEASARAAAEALRETKSELELKKRALVAAETARDDAKAALEATTQKLLKKHRKDMDAALEEAGESAEREKKRAMEGLRADAAEATAELEKAIEGLRADAAKAAAAHKVATDRLEAEAAKAAAAHEKAMDDLESELKAEAAKAAAAHKKAMDEFEAEAARAAAAHKSATAALEAEHATAAAAAAAAHKSAIAALETESSETKTRDLVKKHKKELDAALEEAGERARLEKKKAIDGLEAEAAKTAAAHRAVVAALEAENATAAATASAAHKSAIAALETDASKTATLHKSAMAALEEEAAKAAAAHRLAVERLEAEHAAKLMSALAEKDAEAARIVTMHGKAVEALEADAARTAAAHRNAVADLELELDRARDESRALERSLHAQKHVAMDEKTDRERVASELARLRAALADAETALDASRARVEAAERAAEKSAEARASLSEAAGAAAALEARARAAEEAAEAEALKTRALRRELDDARDAAEKTKLKLATLSANAEPNAADPEGDAAAEVLKKKFDRLISERDERLDALTRTTRRLEAELDAELKTSRSRRVALEDAESELVKARRDSADADERFVAANARADAAAKEAVELEKALDVCRRARDDAEQRVSEVQKNAEEDAKKASRAFERRVAELEQEAERRAAASERGKEADAAELEAEKKKALETANDELAEARKAVLDAEERALAATARAEAIETECETFRKRAVGLEEKAEKASALVRDAAERAAKAETKLSEAERSAKEKAVVSRSDETERAKRDAALSSLETEIENKTARALEDAARETERAKRDAADADARAAAANEKAKNALEALSLSESKLRLAAAASEKEIAEAKAEANALEEAERAVAEARREAGEARAAAAAAAEERDAFRKDAEDARRDAEASRRLKSEETPTPAPAYPVASVNLPRFDSDSRDQKAETESDLIDKAAFDAAAAYRRDAALASENLTVLSLLVQRLATDHLWLNAPRKDAIRFGQQPGPTARAAGKLATRLVAPRVVAATWWEHLLFLCAAWVCVVLAFCYVAGTPLSITPGVLFAPFFPSFVVLAFRMIVTTPTDLKTIGVTTFVLNVCHLLFAPLGCALFFAKLWYTESAIPWWLVFLFPFLALTRVLFDAVRDVVVKMPVTEYAALGYGPEGSAYEFAFAGAAPGEREIDTRTPAREKDVPFVARRVFEARATDEERAEAFAASAEDEADTGETRAFHSASATKSSAVESAKLPPQPRDEKTIPPKNVSFPQPRHHETAPFAVRGFGALPPAPPPGNVASPAGVFLSPRFPTPPARRSPVARGATFGAFAKR